MDEEKNESLTNMEVWELLDNMDSGKFLHYLKENPKHGQIYTEISHLKIQMLLTKCSMMSLTLSYLAGQCKDGIIGGTDEKADRKPDQEES